jgi:hypothetical protein
MDDPADMRDAEGASHIEPDPGGMRRRESAAAFQPRREVLSVDQVHDQVRLAIVGACVEAGDDIRMPEDRRRERLTSEPIREVGVGRSLGSKQLDGDGTLQPEIHRLVDRRHPAPPDDPAELVAVADDPRLAGIRHGGTLAETA